MSKEHSVRRGGRPLLGLVSGLIWGIGAAVLVNQFGLLPLDSVLVRGLPLGAGLLSLLWGRRGRRVVGSAMFAAGALVPATLPAQDPECEVTVVSSTGERRLDETTADEPFELDPRTAEEIEITITAPRPVEGVDAKVWLYIGFGELTIFSGETSQGELVHRLSVEQQLEPFGGMPGLHHVGGSIDGVCESDGYVLVAGGPLDNWVGRGAVGMLVIGLLGTWLAGRRRRAGRQADERLSLPPSGRRWLQARLIVDGAAVAHFRRGASHAIQVRVGSPAGEEETKRSSGRGTPGPGSRPLTVALTEPRLLTNPVLAEIMLPEHGVSTTSQFTLTVDGDTDRVDARLIVLDENRVLHTARLPEQVSDDPPRVGEAPLLSENVAVVETVVGAIGDRDRPRFDAAFIANHSDTAASSITGIAGDKARRVNLDEVVIKEAVARATVRLGEIVERPEDFAGLASPGTRELLVNLARHGSIMRNALVHDFLGETMGRAARLQVVSARPDAYFPFELAYDYPSPRDDATVCPGAADVLTSDSWTAGCHVPHDRSVVCPLGFWGLTKIIERHAFQAATDLPAGFLIRSAPTSQRNRIKLRSGSVFAASDRVDAFRPGSIASLAAVLANASTGQVVRVDSWSDWSSQVRSSGPSLLMLLPHTVFDETFGGFGLEIGTGERRWADEIDESLLSAADRPVMVALLGCETAVAGPVGYERFPGLFRRAGAEIVVATVTEVLGRHAAPIAGRVVDLVHRQVERHGETSLGEVMVLLRRRLLAEGEPAVLVVTAFGDADWLLAA